MRRFPICVLLSAGLASFAQTQAPSQTPNTRELVDGIKNYETSVGFKKTGNFEHTSPALKAYYRCYYTGPLELPESYDKLRLREGSESGCGMDPLKYDVFFYPIEAVASGKTPVTTALAGATPERVLVVVPHEDFHMRKDLPTSIAEAAATLVGFLTAADYARQQFGPDSQVYQNLASEPTLFLRKAVLVNRYYEELREIYRRRRAHALSSPEAFAAKHRLFGQLRDECQALNPASHSFSKCPGADNNAGLAFDRTYTQFYPLLYSLFESGGRDIRTTIQLLDRALGTRSLSEQQAANRIRAAAKGEIE